MLIINDNSSPSETVSEDPQTTNEPPTTEKNSEPAQQALLPQDSLIGGRSKSCLGSLLDGFMSSFVGPSTGARPRKSKFAVPNCS